ncbi:MAG: hypothetical protein RL582_968 [Bacteroidota bacterium]
MQFYYEKMRQSVSIKLGFRIRSKSDCRTLSSLIAAQQIGNLSESTLYRFFLSDTIQKFYPDTLNKLSIFVGKKSWDDFCNHQETSNSFLQTNGIFSEQKHRTSLIKTCVFNDAINPLYDFFEQIPLTIPEHTTRTIVAELYQSLYENKNSNLKFYEHLSGLPYIRNYFFEIGADPDFKIHDYEIGLVQYLRFSNPNHSEIKRLQEQIFAKSMLFRHHYLEGQLDEAKAISIELFENEEIDLRLINKIEVFPASRWYTYRMWWAKNWNRNSISRVEEDFLIFCKHIHKTGNYIDKQIVCYNALDVLQEEGNKSVLLNYILHLFSDIITISIKSPDFIHQCMRLIEPNGIKRMYQN